MLPEHSVAVRVHCADCLVGVVVVVKVYWVGEELLWVEMRVDFLHPDFGFWRAREWGFAVPAAVFLERPVLLAHYSALRGCELLIARGEVHLLSFGANRYSKYAVTMKSSAHTRA